MEPERFVEILTAFLKRRDTLDNWDNSSNAFIEFELNAGNFLKILEEGGEDILRIIESQPFASKFILPKKSFLKMLNSDKLRLKLLAFKQIFARVFRHEILNLVQNCRSPIEVYYGLRLVEMDRYEWGKIIGY